MLDRDRSFDRDIASLIHHYRVHLPVVAIIQNPRYNKLWDCSAESLQEDNTIDLILECSDRIRAAYKEKTKIVNGKSSDGQEASPTMITKILLGTFSCTPAFDQYFIKGLDLDGLVHDHFGRKSQHEIADFYLGHPEFNQALEEVSRNGIYYPLAKLLDMYFWQRGFDDENQIQPAEKTKQNIAVKTNEKSKMPATENSVELNIASTGRRERGSIKFAVEQYLRVRLDEAARNGDEHIEVVALEVAKGIGIMNRFPAIAYAMYKFMQDRDIVVHSTPSGKSSTEKIRYYVRQV